MEKKERLWGKYFILVCLAALGTNICMNMLNANLTPFANVYFQSKTLGGYMTTVFNVGSILMAFFSGGLVDKYGRRNSLIASALLFAIPTFAIAIWPTAAVTLAVRFVQGFGKGLFMVSSAAIVSDVIPRTRMGEGMGYYNLGGTISMAFGPMLALAITANGNFPLMFVVCAILYGSAAVFGLGLGYEKDPAYADILRPAKVEETVSDVEYKGVWKLIEKKALLPALNYTIFFGSNACILVFLTVFSQEILGLSSTQISLFYTVSAIVMLLIRLFGGKLADKYSALVTLIPAHLCNILSVVVLAFFCKGNYFMFLVCGALYGVAQALSLPTLNSIAVVDSPVGRNGAANAAFYFMMDFGIMIASAAFGPVIDKALTPELGYRSVYLISIAVGVFAMLMSIVCFNNKAREKRRAKL